MIRPVSIALITALLITQTPTHRANAQAVIGVPVVETVIIGGIVLYVWYINGQRQESSTYPVLPDPEEEADRMGRPQSETVTAGTQDRATKLCEALAKGRTLQKVQWFESNQWECIFY